MKRWMLGLSLLLPLMSQGEEPLSPKLKQVILSPQLPTKAANGNAGGTGGASYEDEFIGYRQWVIRVLKGEKAIFSREFELTSEAYDTAIRRLERTYELRRDGLKTIVMVDEKPTTVEAILPAPIDKLFVINGKPKDAINLTVQALDLVIYDTDRWDALEGKTARKLVLSAHEHLGILGFETTDENTYSRRFEQLMAKYPQDTPTGIPVVPLWSETFQTTLSINSSESCASPAVQAKLKQLIGDRCRPELPKQTPAPYFDYECALEAKFREDTQTAWSTTTEHIRGYVSGCSWFHSYYYGHPSRYYFKEWETYHPGHSYDKTTTTTTPVKLKSCHVLGTIYLSGIDPIGPDDKIKLIKSSEDTYEEGLSRFSPDPRGESLRNCFEYRRLIRKGLKNHCKVMPLENGNWRWELWAVHPFTIPYPWATKQEE